MDAAAVQHPNVCYFCIQIKKKRTKDEKFFTPMCPMYRWFSNYRASARET